MLCLLLRDADTLRRRHLHAPHQSPDCERHADDDRKVISIAAHHPEALAAIMAPIGGQKRVLRSLLLRANRRATHIESTAVRTFPLHGFPIAELGQRLQNASSNSTSWSKTAPRSMPDTPMNRMLSAYLLALISGTQGRSCATVRRRSCAT